MVRVLFHHTISVAATKNYFKKKLKKIIHCIQSTFLVQLECAKFCIINCRLAISLACYAAITLTFLGDLIFRLVTIYRRKRFFLNKKMRE